MIKRPERQRVYIGLIGAGQATSAAFRQTWNRLQRRVRIVAVYDPVWKLAEQAAQSFDAEAVSGLHALLSHPRVRGGVMLESDWYASAAVKMAGELQKPLLLAVPEPHHPAAQKLLHSSQTDDAAVVMSAFFQRHTPATARLHELMATQLGAPEELEMTIPVQGTGASSQRVSAMLLHAVDWCRYVAGRPPQQVLGVTSTTGPTAVCQAELHFPATKRQPALKASIRLSPVEPNAASHDWQTAVRCRHGLATLRGSRSIHWANGQARQDEELDGERDGTEVLLDLFCRRLAGGLVPVSGYEELRFALDIGQQLESAWGQR